MYVFILFCYVLVDRACVPLITCALVSSIRRCRGPHRTANGSTVDFAWVCDCWDTSRCTIVKIGWFSLRLWFLGSSI